MQPYKKLDQDTMPLSTKQCLRKQSTFFAMINNQKDEKLNEKVHSIIKVKSNQASTVCIYIVLGLTGLGFSKIKFLRPHQAGLAICLLFAYGLGRMYGTVHSLDNIVTEIGEIPYPEIEKVRIELLRRCKNQV